MNGHRGFNLWAWLPVFVIGAAILANGALLWAVRRTGASHIDGQPWEESRRIDDEKQAASAFAASGWRLLVEAAPGGAVARLGAGATPAPAGLVLRVERPNDPRLDQRCAWNDAARPLALRLAPGRWRVRLDGGGGRNLAEAELDLP